MISSYKNPKQLRINKGKNLYTSKRKGASVLEILAVLLIIVVAIIIINPTVVKVRDSINKRQYIVNVNRYIDRAIDMYGNDEYKDKFINNGNEYTIKFTDIDSVNITKDPYGFQYQNEESYVTFNEKNKDIIVNVKSCITKNKVKYCYEIADVNTKDLDTDSIKTSIN